MKSEQEVREKLEYVEDNIEKRDGHDKSHLIGQRNILWWVLEK